jgi:hypothetical protein
MRNILLLAFFFVLSLPMYAQRYSGKGDIAWTGQGTVSETVLSSNLLHTNIDVLKHKWDFRFKMPVLSHTSPDQLRVFQDVFKGDLSGFMYMEADITSQNWDFTQNFTVTNISLPCKIVINGNTYTTQGTFTASFLNDKLTFQGEVVADVVALGYLPAPTDIYSNTPTVSVTGVVLVP